MVERGATVVATSRNHQNHGAICGAPLNEATDPRTAFTVIAGECLAAEAGVKRHALTHKHTDLTDLFNARLVIRDIGFLTRAAGIPSDIRVAEQPAASAWRLIPAPAGAGPP